MQGYFPERAPILCVYWPSPRRIRITAQRCWSLGPSGEKIRLFDALHPLEDCPGDACIGRVWRHYFGDVAVVLIDDVGHVAVRFLELIAQRLGEPYDVGRIELCHRDHERDLGTRQPGQIRAGQLRSGIGRRSSRTRTAPTRPTSA